MMTLIQMCRIRSVDQGCGYQIQLPLQQAEEDVLHVKAQILWRKWKTKKKTQLKSHIQCLIPMYEHYDESSLIMRRS